MRRARSRLAPRREGDEPVAPLVGLIIFLAGLGAGGALTLGGEGAEIARHEPDISAAYGQLQSLCRHDLRDVQGLSRKYPSVDYLQQMARVAHVMCADAQRPNTPVNQARLVIDVMRAYDKTK